MKRPDARGIGRLRRHAVSVTADLPHPITNKGPLHLGAVRVQ